MFTRKIWRIGWKQCCGFRFDQREKKPPVWRVASYYSLLVLIKSLLRSNILSPINNYCAPAYSVGRLAVVAFIALCSARSINTLPLCILWSGDIFCPVKRSGVYYTPELNSINFPICRKAKKTVASDMQLATMWWTRWDSNPRSPRCERGAFPAKLRARIFIFQAV